MVVVETAMVGTVKAGFTVSSDADEVIVTGDAALSVTTAQ
jgi:hypothetical protein